MAACAFRSGLFDVCQHVAHVAVHILDVQPPGLHRLHNVFDLGGIARHHQVVAGADLLLGRQLFALAYPVGHHNALESPLVAQDGGQQVFVALGIDTINDIIRRHQRPRLRLADGHLEALQVQLTQGTLADPLVHLRAGGLLRVDGKVLGTHAHALALYALDDGGTDGSRHDGVFRIILEVAAAQGVTVKVHARAQDDVDAILQRLVADGPSHLFHQFGVPCRGQAGADGEPRGIERLAGAVAVGVDMHAGRSVGHYRCRYSQPRYGYRRAGRTGHELLLVAQHGSGANEVVAAAAHQQLCFLFQGHGLQHLVDVVGPQFRLCCHCRCC